MTKVMSRITQFFRYTHRGSAIPLGPKLYSKVIPSTLKGVIVNKRIITAAALAAGLLVQTQGFTQVPIDPSTSASTAADVATMSDAEKAARKTWRAVMKNIPVQGEGCFHASYPNVVWERAECKQTRPHVHHAPPRPTNGAPAGVGNHNDYIAQAHGLITNANGRFFTGGITSETGVAVAITQSGAILGPNEYSLQLNTNSNGVTAACAQRGRSGSLNHPLCHVWQQFIYATDYNCEPQGSHCGEGAMFIQYWLQGWNDTDVNDCPFYWTRSGLDCYINSASHAPPDISATKLDSVLLDASAENGGNDQLIFVYGDDMWELNVADRLLDIASVWTQAEFNVVGDIEYSQAYFNQGSNIVVMLGIWDGSNSAPTCVRGAGTTGETNSLTLNTCFGAVGGKFNIPPDPNVNIQSWEQITEPYIQFGETYPTAVPPAGPGPCLGCIAN